MLCRSKHREEVAKLKTELGTVQSSSKGGQQAADRSKKEMDKTKCVHAHRGQHVCTRAARLPAVFKTVFS